MAMTARRIAFLDAVAGVLSAGLFLWGRRNLRGNRA